MNTHEIKAFFDKLAPTWDADMVDKSAVIEEILNHAHVSAGQTVLDVACGTGVMFPYYLKRSVASVTGIDLSEEMARIAAEKYADEPKIKVLCGDVGNAQFDRSFDSIMVYNAFPHFPNPALLIEHLASLLLVGGRLTVAHSMSREQINHHHEGSAAKVSMGLMSAEELQELFDPWFEVDVAISDDRMYEVSGVKR